MFEKMLNVESTPVLERMIQFTSARHKLIAENIVNVSTPGYRQKDLSLDKFQQLMQERIEERANEESDNVNFDDIGAEIEEPETGMLFHDGANRSMEQLMSDQAKNALMHNVAVELLRRQFQTLEMALKDRPG